MTIILFITSYIIPSSLILFMNYQIIIYLEKAQTVRKDYIMKAPPPPRAIVRVDSGINGRKRIVLIWPVLRHRKIEKSTLPKDNSEIESDNFSSSSYDLNEYLAQMAEADYLKQVQKTDDKNDNDQNLSKPTIPCLMLPAEKLKNKLEKIGCFSKKENSENHEQIYIQQIQLIQLDRIRRSVRSVYGPWITTLRVLVRITDKNNNNSIYFNAKNN